AADRAPTWLLADPLFANVVSRPKLVLSAGFAGALRPELPVGGLVLATQVTDTEGHTWQTTWPGELPPGEWRPPLHRGRLLASPRLVGDPRHKPDLREWHRAPTGGTAGAAT